AMEAGSPGWPPKRSPLSTMIRLKVPDSQRSIIAQMGCRRVRILSYSDAVLLGTGPVQAALRRGRPCWRECDRRAAAVAATLARK
ncbi:hypothetical protein, partial [Bosea sp. (in: a-proteobacteria)]|uniref:hypothetical protein n=1 Tax=Bosea sp. (in: a-proteobacteria) TaxID=1871050 RepID=UPI002737275A